MSERSTRVMWSPWTPPGIGAAADADETRDQQTDNLSDAARDVAVAEGYAAGLESGQADGYRRGFTEGQAAGREHWDTQCETQARQMEAVLRGVGKALAELDSVAPDSMLDTTLAAARYLAMTAIDASPERVRDVVLKILATDPVWGDKAFLVVHPDDAALLAELMPDQIAAAGLTLRADASMARGDCAITGARGSVKANRAARWTSMLDHLRSAEGSDD